MFFALWFLPFFNFSLFSFDLPYRAQFTMFLNYLNKLYFLTCFLRNFKRPKSSEDRKTHIRSNIWPYGPSLVLCPLRSTGTHFAATIVSGLDNIWAVWVREKILYFWKAKRRFGFQTIRPSEFLWKFGFYFQIFGLIFCTFQFINLSSLDLPYRAQKITGIIEFWSF